MNYRFRQSWLGTFLKCPESARVEMFDKQERGHTDSTALGTAVHGGIEYTLDQLLHDEPAGGGLDVVAHMLDELEPWKYTKYSKVKVRELAAQAYLNWEEFILPEVRPEGSEVEFEVPFLVPSGRDVTLTGTMDCTDTRGFVIDWKSGARAYERWEAQRWNVQATVYSYADSIIRPSIATGEFKFWFMLHDGSIEEVDVTRDARHFAWLGVQVDRICDLIDADLPHWSLNDSGWHCSPTWCSNWDNCRGKVFGPGDGYKS